MDTYSQEMKTEWNDVGLCVCHVKRLTYNERGEKNTFFPLRLSHQDNNKGRTTYESDAFDRTFVCSLLSLWIFTVLHVGVLLVSLSPWDGGMMKLLTCY